MRFVPSLVVLMASAVATDAAGAACWDLLNELHVAVQRSQLTSDEKAELEAELREAELARASDDSASCERLVADVEERVGVAADAEETPVLEAGATDLMNMTTDDLVGRTLLGPGDEVVGDILEIVRDGDTPPRGYAVVAVNDESGVGKKEILIGLDTLRVESEGASLLAPRTAAELATYPEFEEDAYQRYEGPLADIGKAAP